MSGLDKFFDMADETLDKLDGVLPDNPKGLPEVKDASPTAPSETWEKGFEEVLWSPTHLHPDDPAPKPWHAFRGGLVAVCGKEFKSNEVFDRKVLEHTRLITACTSCIIGTSK